jgi:hypothetical protein
MPDWFLLVFVKYKTVIAFIWNEHQVVNPQEVVFPWATALGENNHPWVDNFKCSPHMKAITDRCYCKKYSQIDLSKPNLLRTVNTNVDPKEVWIRQVSMYKNKSCVTNKKWYKISKIWHFIKSVSFFIHKTKIRFIFNRWPNLK